jgi:hypothetical protein
MADMKSLDDLQLHDGTLENVSIDWGAGRAEVLMRTASGTVLLRAPEFVQPDRESGPCATKEAVS